MTLAQGRLDPPLVGWRRLMVASILTGRFRISLICFVGALSLLLVCFANVIVDHGCGDDSVIESFTSKTHVIQHRVAVVCRIDGDIGNVHTTSGTGVVDILRKYVATTSLRASIVSHFGI